MGLQAHTLLVRTYGLTLLVHTLAMGTVYLYLCWQLLAQSLAQGTCPEVLVELREQKL